METWSPSITKATKINKLSINQKAKKISHNIADLVYLFAFIKIFVGKVLLIVVNNINKLRGINKSKTTGICSDTEIPMLSAKGG